MLARLKSILTLLHPHQWDEQEPLPATSHLPVSLNKVLFNCRLCRQEHVVVMAKNPHTAGKAVNELVEGRSVRIRDSAAGLTGSELATTCHLTPSSGKSLTWRFVCLRSTLLKRRGRNTSIRQVREDWNTACRRFLKIIPRAEGVMWNIGPNFQFSVWISNRCPWRWSGALEPKLLGWTYCVTNLLLSWGDTSAVFGGVGRALVSSAVVDFFSLLISLSFMLSWCIWVHSFLYLLLVQLFSLLPGHSIFLVHPYSLLHTDFLDQGRGQRQK